MDCFHEGQLFKPWKERRFPRLFLCHRYYYLANTYSASQGWQHCARLDTPASAKARWAMAAARGYPAIRSAYLSRLPSAAQLAIQLIAHKPPHLSGALRARREYTLSTRSEPDIRSISTRLRRTQPEHCSRRPYWRSSQLNGAFCIKKVSRRLYMNHFNSPDSFHHLEPAQSHSMPGIRAMRPGTISWLLFIGIIQWS